jgi:hypothetical protein
VALLPRGHTQRVLMCVQMQRACVHVTHAPCLGVYRQTQQSMHVQTPSTSVYTWSHTADTGHSVHLPSDPSH